MKNCAFRTMFLLLGCGVVLFPLFSQAGSVNIPGFYGGAVTPPPRTVQTVPSPTGPVNIPGFYGGVVTPPSRTALPVLKPSGTVQGVSGFENPSQNQLVIHQDQPNAIIDWSSFNIGADAHTHFDQRKNSKWVALNRIYDSNPSLIFGRLTADGKGVYLVNQNGILFGPGSKVDVNSLVASALNIKDSDFINGVLKFNVDPGLDYPGLTFDPRAVVSNHGEINAAPGGSVFLIGPGVENAGIINAPVGQVGLAAGTQVDLITDPNGERALIVDVKDGYGEAWNLEGGQLISDTGWAGMYGRVVRQEGLIRSVTAVKQNGQIELRATEKIITGSNSVTESPISVSTETADNSFAFFGGKVWMEGLQTVGGDAKGKQSIITNSPPSLIEHRGTIDAPSGEVAINAGTLVFLETGSRINVGGAWSDETATANVIEAQLDSFQLRDAYGQKDGLLKGEKISVNAMTGSSIGDISRTILDKQKTAQEKNINGGKITVTSGQIISKQGSTLDISGGGIRYGGGSLETTKLLSGTKIYDIGNAPLSIQYAKIMGQYEKTYERFGVKERYSGIYYGGASPLKTGMSGFTRGGDAGSLVLTARLPVVLDGRINGSVTRGFFQTNRTLLESYATSEDHRIALKLSRAMGLEIPQSGSLSIDLSSTGNDDSVIAIRRETSPLPEDFSSDGVPASQQTVISAKTLNEAALGSLNLYADAMITTESNASILLAPGGSFKALASRIEHSGEISAPAGTITLEAVNNPNASDSPQNEGVFLSPGSRLDAAGERVDNSMAGKAAGVSITAGEVRGGKITIWDRTTSGSGVFIQDGATMDVSGGYHVDAKRKITGGNAGTLDIRGSTLMLDGDLRGYALADSQGKVKGGEIILHAGDIEVVNSPSAWPEDFTAGSPVPAGLRGKLVLAGDRFLDTGFTRIELNSFNNITVGPSVEVLPSLVRLQTPAPGLIKGANMPRRTPAAGFEAVSGRDDLIRLGSQMAYQTGPSAFTAAAGKVFQWQDSSIIPNSSATLTVSPGALIRMAPEGKIALSAAGVVTMAGTLEALAGQVGITAGTGGMSDLVIKDSGRILVNGYNRPDMTSTVSGFGYDSSPRAGGQVTLQASNGSLTVEKGSLIDVSGSDAVENRVLSGWKVATYGEASDPGGLSLIYSGNLTLEGDVNARAKTAGLKGGALTVSRTDTISGMDVKTEEIKRYLEAGFDNLTLKSGNSLKFSGAMDVTVGRKLTLDAPGISGSGQDKIFLRSPWISLANTTALPAGGSATAGDKEFTLSSTGWIDLDGKINMSGFSEVRLEAARDIRLTDRFYAMPANALEGQLTTAGDLVLKADRVYPTTLSNYGLKSAGGKVTIHPADKPVGGPIFSAGGSLTVEAQKGIEVRGALAAPMGTVTLKGTGTGSRVYLAEGSVVTRAGNAMVNYGEIDDNDAWVVYDKVSGSYNPMDTVQGKSVTIDAPEVIIRSGAAIDVSGGGSIFAYKFQPGIEGTVNPLTKTKRYVIMSDRSVQLPGDAVYLSGGAGLDAGTYSLLPAEYAFLPGAVVIEEQNLNVTGRLNVVTKDGYPVVAGYPTVFGTGIQSVRPKAYAVKAASDVRSQGNFITKSQTMGDAGDVTVKGNTTVIDGQISAAPLNGYLGGKISLSARDILVRLMVSPLPAGFDFKTGLDSSPELQELRGKLSVAANSLYGKGFQEIDLGDLTVTDNVTVEGGSVLEAPVITLAANKKITVESGARLQAVAESGIGEIILDSPAGTAVIQPGALLHASHGITLNAGDSDIQGDLELDHSALRLKGAEIFFVPTGYTRTRPGLYITESMWERYSAFEDIQLVSLSDLLFMDNFALSAIGSIFIDAARIAGVKEGGAAVSLTAPSINLFNSGAASEALYLTNAGRITFNGDNITVGGGDVLFGGFEAVNFNSRNDLTMKGAGSLKTGGADLNLTAARVTAAFDKNKTAPYIAANFRVDSGSGAISFYDSGGAPGASSVPGGMLEFSAGKIDLSGVVEMNAGTVRMTATGSGQYDGISLHNGGRVLAQGNDLAPGGRVALRTDNGSLVMEPGSLVDVSAGAQGDSGVATLQAPMGGVSPGGTLRGVARGGVGGSLVLDTKQLSAADMTGLIGALATGGFTESLDIRAHTGDIDIVAGQALAARRVKLSADGQSNGRINLSGTIDAGAGAGGSVELYAMNDMNISSGGLVNAANGTVLLSSDNGWVNVNAGGTVDVAGKTAGDAGGTVWLRAERSGNDMKVNLNGAIAGAAAVYAEAVKTYSYTMPALSANTQYAMWLSEAASYYGANTAVNRLNGAAGASSFHLLPGIEVSNSGDINLDIASGWDLTSARYGSAREPGVLTLRAGGNLNVNTGIVDHPTPKIMLPGGAGINSWAVNLVAGADTAGAGYLAVKRGQGNLNIKNQGLVYTESAPIRFASGNDTVIGAGKTPRYMVGDSLSYNLASYGGPVRGDVGGDLIINGGAIQTATGDIDIGVGRDLILNENAGALGSIRTTGQHPSIAGWFWQYTGGGDIAINVGRTLAKKPDKAYLTALNDKAWERFFGMRESDYRFGPESTGVAGLATMGGGDLAVRTGGDFMSQAGTFGQGDLIIRAGGDLKGRFLNRQGRAELHAQGNFGSANEEQVIEAFDSRIGVSAAGDIVLGAVLNPTITHDKFQKRYWKLTYTEEASLGLRAGRNVTITGKSRFYTASSDYAKNFSILPPTVEIEAGGDIRLKNDFALAPSAQGNLRLIAGGDIDGFYGNETGSVYDSKIYISDMAPADVYKYINTGKGNYGDNLFNQNAHAKDPLHQADGKAVEVRAGRGINNLMLFLPKRAEITAGRDIRELYYFGQNVNPGDASKIRAGGDVVFSYKPSSTYTGMVQAGPGLLLLQAGGSIDLGKSNGIQSIGNQFNLPLGGQGSSVIVLSGYGKEMNLTEAGAFFDGLRGEIKSGGSYNESSLKAATDIIPALGPPSGSGDINMTVSQISTNYGKSDIFIFANGSLNVGKSVFFKDEDSLQTTGILTSEGGAINIFANGDVNVNESRVMTFFGGDITVWSDHGDINAGRGSKTAIKPGEKKKKLIGRIGDRDIYADVFNPPAVGSGIRAVTYDPDGLAGSLQAPQPGDIYPHAKVIDAGEAGLSGGNIFLQAQQVLNAANISSTLGSVAGMPQAAAGTANIGSLSGAGTVTAGTTQLPQGTAGISSSNAARASQMIEDIMAKWLDVKVVDFVQDE